jgi:hypothetical protein
LSDPLNTDKVLRRKRILELRQQGMSYQQIGVVLDIHWTREETLEIKHHRRE